MILSLVVLKRQPKDFYQMSRLRLNKDGGVSWLFQPWGRLGVEEVGGVISLLCCTSWLPSQGYLDVYRLCWSLKIFNGKCDSWQSWPPCRGVLLLTLRTVPLPPPGLWPDTRRKTWWWWCDVSRKDSLNTRKDSGTPLGVLAKCDRHLPVTPH